MVWGTRILAICLLITLVFVSGCILDYGQNKLDFGNSDQAKEALACFCQTYGDPATYNGPPRLIAPLVSTELKDNIPQDKVSRLSTGTDSIFFWVIYQNFQQGDDLHLSWIFQDKVATTITKKIDAKTGVAFGEFIRPDAGWPIGVHTIKIEGEENSTQVTFDIANGPTERTIFDFTGPKGVSCSDLMTYIPVTLPVVSTPDTPSTTQPVISTPVTPPTTGGDYWISGRTSNPALSCYPPVYTIQFLGSTGTAVTPGTPVQLKLFNLPDANNQEILIGSTNTANDRSWEYTWNGNVPGYMLKNGQEYSVKAVLPDGTYTKMSFLSQCSDPEGKWQIYGGPVNSVLSCSPPNNTIKFTGGTGPSVTRGIEVQLRLFHMPDAGDQEILLGSTTTRNDGTWEYTWNGKAAGYTFVNGQEYGVKSALPWRYTKMGFTYKCPK